MFVQVKQIINNICTISNMSFSRFFKQLCAILLQFYHMQLGYKFIKKW
jgi:hypothetical protein